MKVKELRDALKNFDDDIEVMTKKTEVFGNIGYIFGVRKASYGRLGDITPCILLSDESFNNEPRLIDIKNNYELYGSWEIGKEKNNNGR